MQVDSTKATRGELAVKPVRGVKQRVRNEYWHMVRRADRRRKQANAIVAVSALAVLGLVGFFYVLLTR